MLTQIAKYGGFYAAVALAGALIGWHASSWLSTFGEEFDPRIEGRW